MERRAVIISMLGIAGLVNSEYSAAEIVDGMLAYKKARPRLNSEKLDLLKVVSDIIFPETETPSARQAGVHLYIDYFVHEYYSEERRSEFFEMLEKCLGSPSWFLGRSQSEQVAVIEKMDNTLGTDAEIDFYRNLKNMIISAFFSSEVGAKQILKFDPVPGGYQEMPLQKVGRAWF